MKYLLTLLIALIADRVDAQSRKLPPAEARADLQQLRGILEECYPGYTNYASADSLRYWFTRTEAHLTDSLLLRDFWLVARQLVNRVRCAHTTVSMPVDYKGKPAAQLPLSLLVDERENWVRLRSTGDTVLAINGRSIRDVQTALGRLITTDGFSPGLRKFVFEQHAARYYQARFGRTDSLRLTIRGTDGQLKERLISANTTADSSAVYLQGVAGREVLKSERLSVYEMADGTTVMRLRAVGNWTDRWRLGQVFRQLRRQQNPRLVLDLRGNLGGKLRTARWLLRHLLAQPAQIRYERYAESRPFTSSPYFTNGGYILRQLHHLRLAAQTQTRRYGNLVQYSDQWNPVRGRYAGPLAVLVDGGTASAASLVAAYLHDQQRGPLLGQETGGGSHLSGGLTVPTARLTHSGVQVTVPFFRVMHQLRDVNLGRGVIPDQPIETGIGQDAVLRRALAWLNGQPTAPIDAVAGK